MLISFFVVSHWKKKLMATLSTTGIGSELNLACKELNFSESLEKNSWLLFHYWYW